MVAKKQTSEVRMSFDIDEFARLMSNLKNFPRRVASATLDYEGTTLTFQRDMEIWFLVAVSS